jgi:hypothetical protein
VTVAGHLSRLKGLTKILLSGKFPP